MLSPLRRYWPVIPIAAVFLAGVFFEWTSANGPHPPSYAAAPQIPALAPPQPPAPNTPTVAQPQKQNPTQQPKLSPTGESCSTHECRENAATEAVAKYTKWLAWVTAVLAAVSLWQGYFLIRADKTARISAEVAKKSADAAVAAERARFHVIIGEDNLSNFIRIAENYSSGGSVRGDIRISCRFKNYGKGPGLINEFSYGMLLSPTPPDTVIYTVLRWVPDEYMIPSVGQTEWLYCDGTAPFDSRQVALEITAGRMLVWFAGRFDYIDFVTNKPQVHRFLMRYVRTESGDWRFQSFDHKHYNQSS